MFRSLLINLANSPAPIPPQPTLGDYVIVGPAEIDGDVRAGVYSILDKKNLTMVSDRASGSSNVSAGYTIYWQSNNQNVTCSTGSYNEKMHLNINSQMSNQMVRISATLMLPGGDVETVYKDVVCTYAPADYVINSLSDWLDFKSAIDNGTESTYYPGATTGFANKRIRLGCDLTFDYDTANYTIGRYNSSSRSGPYFAGVFDGADYTFTVSGTHPYNSSTDRSGGVFSYIRAARLLNFNVVGSIANSVAAFGVVGAAQLNSRLERICAKMNVTNTSGSYAAAGIGGVGYLTSSSATEHVTTFFKDVFYCGHVTATAHAGGLSYDWGKVKRCIVLGKIESKNTENPVKTGSTLRDSLDGSAIYAEDFFSKAILVKGASYLRGCFQVMNTVPDHITNIFDLNQKASNTGNIFQHSGVSSTSLTNCYSLQGGGSSGYNSSWRYLYGTKINSFQDACETDYFANNDNWIKGDVGTNIINNQYATDSDVLSAAKKENYYGNTLPTQYQRLEYVKTTGAAAFKVSYNPTSNTPGFELEFKVDSSANNSSETNSIFGVYASTGSTTWYVQRLPSTHSSHPNKVIYNYYYSNNVRNDTNYVYDSSFKTIKLKGSEFISSDGISHSVNNPSSGQYYGYIGIGEFWRPDNNAFTQRNNSNYAYIKYLSLFSGNNKVYEFIPCKRLSDNKIGMYDLVNNVFYSSETNTEFIGGNPI